MQKDVTLCKDCLYRGSGLCPVKTEEWVLADDSFCFAGQEKPKIEVGALLFRDGDHILVVGDKKTDPDIFFCVHLDGHEVFGMSKEDLNEYVVLGCFPYRLLR